MTKPAFAYENRRVRVASFGKLVSFDPKDHVLTEPLAIIGEHAKAMGARDVLVQRISNTLSCGGRFSVLPRKLLPRQDGNDAVVNNERLNGLILRRGEACAIITRDCYTGIVCKNDTDKHSPVLVMHISRDSVQGTDLGQPAASVVINGMNMCLPEWGGTKELQAIITTGIAAEHFPNERYPNEVENLRDLWGDGVIPDAVRSTIDLPAVVAAQLLQVFNMHPKKQIVRDKLDTFSNTELASKRRGDEGNHNVVIVVCK